MPDSDRPITLRKDNPLSTMLAPLHLPQAVTDAVHAHREARAAREHAWAAYSGLLDAHNARAVEVARAGGRKLRRSRELIRATATFEAAEHRATAARARVEQEVRTANPDADSRAVMATVRALV